MAVFDANANAATANLTGIDGEADVFKFAPGHGFDKIYDFDPSEDMLDLTGLGHQLTWDDLQNSINITHYVGAANYTEVNIDLSAWGGGKISVRGIDGHLSMDDVKKFITFETPVVGGDSSDDLYGDTGNDDISGGAGADYLYGYGGDDNLKGGAGDDWIAGGKGDDRIVGGAGNDTLYGNGLRGRVGASVTDNDTFVYGPGGGNDVIADFRNGEDRIDVSAFGGISGFSDISATQDGSDVVIAFSGGGSITLANFKLDDLDESDFVFQGDPDADAI